VQLVAGKLKTGFLLGASLLLSLLIAEAGARFGFPEWREFLSERFIAETNVPGHGAVSIGRVGFNGYFSQNDGDFRARIKINEFGLRNTEPVTASNNRIWVVGDSVAFGWGVSADQMMSTQLARLSNTPTYNVASPGSDICGYQALVSRMPTTNRPRGSIIVLTLENDLREYDCQLENKKAAPTAPGDMAPISLPGTKEFMMKYSALYNLSAVAVKRTPVIRDLLIDVGVIAAGHVVKMRPSESKTKLQAARTAGELLKLRAMFPADIPVGVLLVPARFEVRDNDSAFRQLREAVKYEVSKSGLDVIDPFESFRQAGFSATHFPHDGHWSAKGHAIAAKAAARWLASKNLH
jgi:hypothetical protein